MKVIIAGTRNFNNLDLVERVMATIPEVDEVVCGGARGADDCGRRWAEQHNIPVSFFPAEWDRYGKAAGYIRNKAMGEYADFLVAFWDGQSKGTKNMIDIMNKLGKHGQVILFEEQNND